MAEVDADLVCPAGLKLDPQVVRRPPGFEPLYPGDGRSRSGHHSHALALPAVTGDVGLNDELVAVEVALACGHVMSMDGTAREGLRQFAVHPLVLRDDY